MSFVFFGCSGFPLIHAGFSVVAASEGYSSLHCMGFSLWWLLSLWSGGSRHASFSSCGSWALEHWLSSCGTWLSSFKACGIFLARGWFGRCILHHWATGEVLSDLYLKENSFVYLWPCKPFLISLSCCLHVCVCLTWKVFFNGGIFY